MEQTNGEPAQPSKSDAEAPSLAAASHAAPPPLNVNPMKEAADGSASGNPDPNPSDGSEAKPSPGIKSPKSVRWSEQLVSESTFTADVDPDEPSSNSARSSPYFSNSYSTSSESFKGRMILLVYAWQTRWMAFGVSSGDGEAM
ncbi:hypothetical protein V2J09_016676 [Rumex salicifolius]